LTIPEIGGSACGEKSSGNSYDFVVAERTRKSDNVVRFVAKGLKAAVITRKEKGGNGATEEKQTFGDDKFDEATVIYV
jgi:hypothetical protein